MKRYALLAGFLVLGCGLAPAPTLADQAAINAVIGKTWNFEQGKTKGQIFCGPSTVKATFGGATYDGTLRVKGDQICTSYPKLRKGKEACFTVSKSGKGYKTSNGGTLWQ